MKDFKAHFVDLMICKLTPDLMSQENGKKWMCSMQFGRWVKGSTAGGRVRLYKGKSGSDASWTLGLRSIYCDQLQYMKNLGGFNMLHK